MSRLSRLKPFDDQSAHLDRFGWVLFLSVISIIALALVDQTGSSEHVIAGVASVGTTVLVGVTFMLALRASGVAHKWQRAADAIVAIVIVVLVLLVAGSLVSTVSAVKVDESSHPLLLLVIAALAPLVVVRRLLHHHTVTTGTLLGAISAFLLIPIAFCYAFLTINSLQSTPFFGQPEPSTSFMYFSLSTVTTVGYGDLAAVTPFARLVANAEAVSGQVYLVTFVAMLVGLRAQAWASGRKNAKAAAAGEGTEAEEAAEGTTAQ
jgi:hypothetical protein